LNAKSLGAMSIVVGPVMLSLTMIAYSGAGRMSVTIRATPVVSLAVRDRDEPFGDHGHSTFKG
jgi:hypothetical protein